MAGWNYQPDSFSASLLWGRIGAAVLMLASVAMGPLGIDFGVEAQQATFDAVAAVLGGIAVVLAVVSKARERKKTG